MNANDRQQWPLERLVEENTKTRLQARRLICRSHCCTEIKLREIYNPMLRPCALRPSASSLKSRLDMRLRRICSFAFLKTRTKQMHAVKICIIGCRIRTGEWSKANIQSKLLQQQIYFIIREKPGLLLLGHTSRDSLWRWNQVSRMIWFFHTRYNPTPTPV